MAAQGTLGVRRLTLVAASMAIGMMSLAASARAQNAIWLASPGSGDFNTAANWNPATVPTGTASFGFSNAAALSFSADTTIGGITLNSGASAYNFTVGGSRTVTFTGAGITINGGSAAFTNGYIVNFDNASTAGRSTINNNNTLAFYNAATAGGSTIVNNDYLQFFNSSSAGSSALTNNNNTSFFATSTAGSANITNNSMLAFYETSTAGTAHIANNSDLLFSDTSTAGSANITNNSIVAFFNSTSATSATITNNAGGQTQFNDTSTAGNAAITNNGGSTLFQNSSTAGNATITNSGVLEFVGSSTAGNATITNGIGSVVVFQNNTTAGNARLVNNVSGGIFDFSASVGLLGNGQLSAGSIEGGGSFGLGLNELVVGSNDLSTTVSGVITGNGRIALVKVGSGTLALTGTNPYSGRTLVNGGTLEVDGSIVSSNTVVVNAGGTLSGTGAVTRAAIEAGGTLAPGSAANPTGTLTSMTNLTLVSGAFYMVQVGAGASNTNVVGTASVANATAQVAVTGGAQGNKSYDILHSSRGIGGSRFRGVQSLTPGFTETLSYSATDVFLNLTANLGGGGQNFNQQNVATGINNAFNNGGSLPAGFLNLFNLSGVPLANALTQLSGETATGSLQTTFDAMGMFMGVMTDPFMNRTGGFGSPLSSGYAEENAYAARSNPTDAFAMFTKAPTPASAEGSGWGFEQRWSVWAAGFGGSQNTTGNAVVGSNNTTSNIAGTAVGADYLISPNTIAGFALAGGGTSFNVANGGTGRSDLFQFGAYVRHTSGPAYISAALAYGWQDIITNRTLTAAGFDQLRAEFNANAWSGRLEGGYRFVSPATLGVGITPYAAALFVTFDLPAYMEQAIVGSNNFALSYGAQDATDVRTELGIRTDKSWLVTDGVVTLRGRLAWAHDYDPDRSIAATFQALPGASFVVNGAAQASDSALTTASIEMKWRNGWSMAATFEGEFSNVTSSYAGTGTLRYQW